MGHRGRETGGSDGATARRGVGVYVAMAASLAAQGIAALVVVTACEIGGARETEPATGAGAVAAAAETARPGAAPAPVAASGAVAFPAPEAPDTDTDSEAEAPSEAPSEAGAEAPSEAGSQAGADSEPAPSLGIGSEAAGFGDPPVLGARPPARTRVPPASPEEAHDPAVAAAMRAAPPAPPLAERYRGADPAMEAAREIRRRVPRFVNYRAAVPLGTWEVDEARAFRVRPTAECHAALREAGVRFTPYEPDPEDDEALDVFPVPAPVIVTGPVDGVSFISGRGPLLISCELAARLPTIARVARAHDIERVMIASSWRERPLSSFHTLGMGLDITRVRTTEPVAGLDGEASRWLVVQDDFVETPGHRTCDPELLADDGLLSENDRGRRLLAFACDLFATGEIASVLTPSYNSGHRDHFHVDIRPDDPRSFIR